MNSTRSNSTVAVAPAVAVGVVRVAAAAEDCAGGEMLALGGGN
jgi:hypothetical protein